FEYGRMVVAGDHRAPGADVVDVAVAVDVVQERAVRAPGEERFAAYRPERAHRRVDATGHQLAGAGKQGAGAFGIHAAVLQKSARSARAAVTGSGASKTAPTTASRSAPAAIGIPALSGVIPPIATSGRPNPVASRSSPGVARRAPGLVADGKNAPNAR